MGVKGLWEVLSPAGTEVSHAELEGLHLAVDLSVWICQLKSKPDLQNLTCLRNLYYRTTYLMKLGVKLVFVFDGKPPEMKKKVMEERQTKQGLSSMGRETFNNSKLIKQARVLLQSLGLPCIQADGEGEALCAQLTTLQAIHVDGCLTDDGDALLYGARTVYKNFSLDKETVLERYSIEDIKEKLDLDKDDMIAIAILAGCDYTEKGVKDVGMKKAVELIKHLKTKQHHPLERIRSWRDCPELDQIVRDRKMIKKKPHCSYCQHLGTINVHKSNGCDICKTGKDCKEASDTENSDHHDNKHRLCPCEWHVIDRQVKDHHLELNIRKKALQVEEFPDMETVEEYSGTDSTQPPVPDLTWRKPSLQVFVEKCATLLLWKEADCVVKFLPTLVWSDLKAQVDADYFSVIGEEEQFLRPYKILKSCQKNHTPCYQVCWVRLTSDRWSSTSEENYTTTVDQKMFKSVFTEMVQEFEDSKEKEKAEKTQKKTKSKARKRKSNDNDVASGQQSLMTSFFKKKKKQSPTVSQEHEKSSSSPDES